MIMAVPPLRAAAISEQALSGLTFARLGANLCESIMPETERRVAMTVLDHAALRDA
jgi:hypothetical protein